MYCFKLSVQAGPTKTQLDLKTLYFESEKLVEVYVYQYTFSLLKHVNNTYDYVDLLGDYLQ